jgi:hypothetical protein
VPVRVVTVESQDAVGGKPSAVTSATHYRYVAGPPSAPRDVVVHKHGTTVHVHWKGSLADGGSPVTGYRVSAVALPFSPGSTPPGVIIGLARPHHPKLPPTVAVTTKAGVRAASLKALRAGWTYVIRVQAINRHGRGAAAVFRRPLLIKQAA